MSVVAELVARLIAAGTPADVAAMAITEAFAAGVRSEIPQNSADVSAERRRERDRIRKRNAKNIPQNSAENAEIPQNSDSALSSFVNSDSEQGRKQERAEPKKAPRKTGERLPDHWMPSADHYREGAELGLSREAVNGMARDMRLWAKSNEHRAVARKSDWDLTFSGWMRREAKSHKGRGPPGNSFAELHNELSQGMNGRNHESPSIADDFDGPELDLTINDSGGGPRHN